MLSENYTGSRPRILKGFASYYQTENSIQHRMNDENEMVRNHIQRLSHLDFKRDKNHILESMEYLQLHQRSLSQQYDKVSKVIWEMPWKTCPEDIYTKFVELVIPLLKNQQDCLITIIKELVKVFTSAHPAMQSFSAKSRDDVLKVTRIHDFFQRLQREIPCTFRWMVSSHKTQYPFPTRDFSFHDNYLRNTIVMMGYINQKEELLKCVVEKFIEYETAIRTMSSYEEARDKLKLMDEMILLILNYFKRVCYEGNLFKLAAAQDLQAKMSKNLKDTLMKERELPMYTHILHIYLACLHRELGKKFVLLLLDYFTPDEGLHTVMRAATYLNSILSKIPTDPWTVVAALTRLKDWIALNANLDLLEVKMMKQMFFGLLATHYHALAMFPQSEQHLEPLVEAMLVLSHKELKGFDVGLQQFLLQIPIIKEYHMVHQGRGHMAIPLPTNLFGRYHDIPKSLDMIGVRPL